MRLIPLCVFSLTVLTVIILLRVFMAMLTTTFNGINKEAVLRWRLQFAHHVLQHELIAARVGMRTQAGEQIDGNSFYVFRAYLDIDAIAPPPAITPQPLPPGKPAAAKPGISSTAPRTSTRAVSQHKLLDSPDPMEA